MIRELRPERLTRTIAYKTEVHFTVRTKTLMVQLGVRQMELLCWTCPIGSHIDSRQWC
jgi:hypothetical protein